MKELIKIAAKMYECQENAMTFFKDEYQNKIKWYKDTLKMVMAKEKLDELHAVLFVSKLESVKDEGFAVMMFLAATVELIEHPELTAA